LPKKAALAWMKQNLDEAQRTQITYFKTLETIAMKTNPAPWSTHIAGAELQFWIGACKTLGLTEGSVGLPGYSCAMTDF
jgi:hypothetical protein